MSVTGFLVNGQVQKYDYESLDNLPDDTGAGSFPVIYNVTTASEITQALNKNQIPILKEPTTGSLYYLNSSAELNGDRIYIFVSNQGNKMRQVEVVGNTWGSFSDTILALNTSPTFQGVPKAPTAPTGTNNTQLATTAFVQQEIMYVALSENLKQALLQIASKVVYIDADGQTYYNDLENALYPHDLLGIEATFTQGSAIIYDTDSLNDLKQYLTVVATYSGGDTETLSDSDYTLSGNLLSGVSEITVTYEGFTDTFDVVVTHMAGYYTIVNNLTGCTTNNSATSIQENTTYTATITASVGYTLSGATATITMGGNILTGVFSNGTISIPSVTGDLVITVVASAITVSSISAVYTQTGVVYTTDTLDSLKDDLVVTANYSDSTTAIVPAADYTLSGTLSEGTSTITVSYGGKTTTFNVIATVNGWLYHFNESLLSSGSEDFGFTGEGVYADGLFNRKAYSRIIPSGTAAEERQQAIKAVNVSKFPNFGGDYTLSFWAKTQDSTLGYPFWATTYNSGSASTNYYSSVQSNASGWSVVNERNGPANSGFGFQIYQSRISPRISASTPSTSGIIGTTPPSGFAYNSWHHYAMTRKGTTVRLFVDGVLVATAVASNSTVYPANQVAIYDIFKNSSGTTDPSGLSNMAFGGYIQDLYIAEFCKWESSFDPQSIIY